MCRIGAISLTNAVAVGGGERVTMVMMFVGGVVFDVQQISRTIPTVQYLRGGSFLFPPEPL